MICWFLVLVVLCPVAKDFYLYLAVNHMHPGNTGYDYRVPDQEPRNGHSSHRSGEATHCLKVSFFCHFIKKKTYKLSDAKIFI